VGTRAPRRKEKNFWEVGKNFVKRSLRKAQALSSKRPVPISRGSPSRANLKKAFRIQLVRSSIIIINSSLITQHSALPHLCKFVAVFAAYLVKGEAYLVRHEA
jgi:hypothetical protein